MSSLLNYIPVISQHISLRSKPTCNVCTVSSFHINVRIDSNRVLFLVLVELLDFLDLHVVSGNRITRAKHKKHSFAVPTPTGNLLTVLESRKGVTKGVNFFYLRLLHNLPVITKSPCQGVRK